MCFVVYKYTEATALVWHAHKLSNKGMLMGAKLKFNLDIWQQHCSHTVTNRLKKIAISKNKKYIYSQSQFPKHFLHEAIQYLTSYNIFFQA